MNKKQFISNLSSVQADIRKLDAKKIFLNNKNILEYIEESTPTITHSKDTRETVYENDLWGQWVETKDDGTIVIHDDYLSTPNGEETWLSNVKAVQDNKAYSEITTGADGKFTSVVEDSVVANIQTEMIKDGSKMFYYNSSLASFNGDLSSLVDGSSMFSYNSSLASFSGDLSSLINGSYMFYYTKLESFSGDLSTLVDGERMFFYTSLESFSGDLSSLVNGESMFDSCGSLKSFNGDSSGLPVNLSSLVNGSYMFSWTSLESFDGYLSSLVNGAGMFSGCSSLTSFNGHLSSLVNGESMFANTSLTSIMDYISESSVNLKSLVNGSSMFYGTSLASFSGDLSSLVNGKQMFTDSSLSSFTSNLNSLVNGSAMFSNTSLTSFSGDLSSLVNGVAMFKNCTELTSFSGDLSSLTNGEQMFHNTSLKSFSGDLSSLVDGYWMFSYISLTSFSGDLSSIVKGNAMFDGCTEFTSFSGDLSSLVDGHWMFRECKLSPQSVMYIVESIRNIIEEKTKYTNGEIPWVIYDSTTRKYSVPFGFMEDGKYVYTYNDPNLYTTTISSSNVGKLTLGINVTNDSETIEQQLKTFAEGCLCDSWAELKQEFIDKGWTVTFQYGGTDSSITLSEDEKFRGVPVYARLIEVSDEDKDMAEYCTEDGTKFYDIDWGHDVTDYNSYQYFGSLLEACGYFGVIPKKYLEEA